jgi:hypothetical protein
MFTGYYPSEVFSSDDTSQYIKERPTPEAPQVGYLTGHPDRIDYDLTPL